MDGQTNRYELVIVIMFLVAVDVLLQERNKDATTRWTA